MFKWIASRFTRRNTERRISPPKSRFPYYIGAGLNPRGGDKMHLYLFNEKPIRMDLCISKGDRLSGKRVSEGGPLIGVHLNDCINGNLETAIRDGKIIELTSKTEADAFEEAKGYQIMSYNKESEQYCQVGIRERRASPKSSTSKKSSKSKTQKK